MKEKQIRVKDGVIRWHQFSRKKDAIFRSLGREIVISVLTVATLQTASLATARAQSARPLDGEPEKVVLADEVCVNATRVPSPMGQSARIVSVIGRESIKDIPAQSVNELLQFLSSVDVRQRGAFGIQTDISVNGGTHDQIVVLLNGVNISSPHTGHLSVDLPVSLDDVERIEVLEGAASRVYGTSAFSGAINIITTSYAASRQDGRRISGAFGAQGGSFGTFGVDASLGHSAFKKKGNGALSVGYMQSDGGTDNSDFQKCRAYYQGGVDLADVGLNWQVGMSRMDYGANTFYSGRYPNQHEENQRLIGSVNAQTKGRIVFTPTLYWSRSTDHYQLIKGTGTGENFHMTDVYGLSANARTSWQWGTTSIGAEFRNEGILSTALGRPLSEELYVGIPGHDGFYTKQDNRTNVCYFLEHDILLRRWSFSLGVMANMNTGLDYRYRLYPGVDVSFRPSPGWKVYASWNMAQRIPTFTDLYYKSPTQEGNTGLQPEETNDFAIGGKYRARGLAADVRLFYRHERSMIDWIMTPEDSVNGYTTYHAANFKIDNMGATVNAELLFREWLGEKSYLKSLGVKYSYIHQNRHDDVDVYASSYSLDYLRHKFVAQLESKLYGRWNAALTYLWQQRMGGYVKYSPSADGKYVASNVSYHPYGLLNVKVNWTGDRCDFYLEGKNLTSYRYYDVGNVQQPGFWLMTGAKLKF